MSSKIVLFKVPTKHLVPSFLFTFAKSILRKERQGCGEYRLRRSSLDRKDSRSFHEGHKGQPKEKGKEPKTRSIELVVHIHNLFRSGRV